MALIDRDTHLMPDSVIRILKCMSEFHSELMILEKNVQIGKIGNRSDITPVISTTEELTLRYEGELKPIFQLNDTFNHHEILYALVAILDETLINLDWHASDAWSNEPLELKMFNSRNAGSKIFDEIERLSIDRRDDQCRAILYWILISFGFMGKYAPHHEDDKLLKAKEKCFFISKIETLDKHFNSMKPDQRSITFGQKAFLPDPRIIKYRIVLVVCLSIISGYLIWLYFAQPISEALNAILEFDVDL